MKFIHSLFNRVDIASMVFFRITFGSIMLWEVWRYFYYDRISNYFIEPLIHFSYFGFDWISPWPGNGMYYHFYALGLLAIMIILGLFYRIAALFFFLGFSYVFLLDQAQYLNHYYLVILLSFLLIFLPAHKAFSLDSLRKPSLHSNTIPAWSLWILRFQVAVPYFFGGIAKINYDWLRGEPLRMWLADRSAYLDNEFSAYFFSYGGLLFDLLIIPFLLWKKTRPFAFCLVLAFNLSNFWLFNIGIFPWMMIAATTIFFEPDWPRRTPIPKETFLLPSKFKQYTITSLLAVFILYQVYMPFRHFLYPGMVHWTEEGHLFSWHMKLRDKDGFGEFILFNPETNQYQVVYAEKYLTFRQWRKMMTRPDMAIQFAHYLAEKSPENTEVHAHIEASLNGRPYQLLIDPAANLAEKNRSIWPADWILHLE